MDYLNQFTSLVVNLSVKHQVTVLVTCFLFFGILVYSLCARIYRKKLALMEKDRLEDQKSSLVSLATSKEIRSGNLESSFQKIVKESSNKLNSSVSTIWLVEKDNFKCVTGYDHDKNRFITEYKVLSEDYPNFYKTLQRVRINAISDITKSGLQFEFKKLLNNGIRAVLSTPIRVDGELTAFLCHCNRGEPREWTLSEENYAASIADITSMFIHSSEKQKFTEQINRLVHAIESSVDGMAILDTQGKYVYMNDVHAEIFGYSNSKELISKSWEVLYEEEERERISNKILPNLVAGKSLRLETEGKKKDGSKFPQEAILTLSHDGGLVCVCRDISEKKRVEAEIKQLAEYTTLNPSPVFRFNFTGKITHSNPAAAKLKITRDTQYLNLLKLIPQLTLSDLEKCIEQNETISYTTCIGDYCFLIVLQGVASQRSGYAYATDITSQQAAETNLKKSKKFLRTIIDLDPNFIFVKDREGRFTLVNKAVADAYGTTPEKLVGKKDIDFNDQIQEVEHFREADIRVIVGNEELFIPEEEITDSGGNIRYLQTVKKPLRLSDEEESVVLGVSTDITKQKELQSQLFHAQKMDTVSSIIECKFIGIF